MSCPVPPAVAVPLISIIQFPLKVSPFGHPLPPLSSLPPPLLSPVSFSSPQPFIYSHAPTTAYAFSRGGRADSYTDSLFEWYINTVRSASAFGRWRFIRTHCRNCGRCCRRRGACHLVRDHMEALGSRDPAHGAAATQGSGTFTFNSSTSSVHLSWLLAAIVKELADRLCSKIYSPCGKTPGGMLRTGSDRNRSTGQCSHSTGKAAG